MEPKIHKVERNKFDFRRRLLSYRDYLFKLVEKKLDSPYCKFIMKDKAPFLECTYEEDKDNMRDLHRALNIILDEYNETKNFLPKSEGRLIMESEIKKLVVLLVEQISSGKY